MSSEILLIEDGSDRFVVKRALPRLRVADEWRADTSRNQYEADYLEYAGGIVPAAVPRVLARGDDWFAMEYLGSGFVNWKSLLLSGTFEAEHAQRAGDVLHRIHSRSRTDDEARSHFRTLDNFEQLRIDPYLITTGKRHPELRERFEHAAAELRAASECLVHGDYSPKNALVSSDRFIILDCEVAWFGDPAFDLAFLLNHLLLKSLFHAPTEVGAAELVETFCEAYGLSGPLMERALRLVLLLMLARVDGKSPVEYLRSEKQERVRAFCRPRILNGEALDMKDWFQFLRQSS